MKVAQGYLTYFEKNGFDYKFCCLVDFAGIYRGPDKQVFYDLKYVYPIQDGDILTVFENSEDILWRGVIKKDVYRTKTYELFLNIIPRDIELKNWLEWFKKEKRAELVLRKENE